MLSRNEPPVHGATSDWGYFSADCWLTAACWHIPSVIPDMAYSGCGCRRWDCREVVGLCSYRRISQLESSPWRISVPFCGLILSHCCSRDILKDGVFPLYQQAVATEGVECSLFFSGHSLWRFPPPHHIQRGGCLQLAELLPVITLR
jgi:hypothetical protein